MTGQKGVKNVGYLMSRHKSTKARKCKFSGCKRTVREENKSGYCGSHYNQSPNAKMRAIRAAKKNRDINAGVSINREIYNDFVNFCEQDGFSKKKKLELIIKDFLTKHDALQKDGE